MEDRSSLVPSFARGLSILLVDHDTTSLVCLSSMLEQYTFKVTTTELASVALSMIEEQKDRFKLVMASVTMPDMDSVEFLKTLLDKNIPVILMSSQTDVSAATKAIAERAVFFLYKPISIDDLRYVWQHAYRNKNNVRDQTQDTSCQEMGNNGNMLQDLAIMDTTDNDSWFALVNDFCNESNQNACKEVELGGNINGNGAILDENCMDLDITNMEDWMTDVERLDDEKEKEEELMEEKMDRILFEEDNIKGKEKIIDEDAEEKNSSNRKSRILWTPELHLKFTAAISALGDKKARPKPILEMMNVPHLTQRQVASHLQKYKSQVQRICETGCTILPAVSRSSNFFDRPPRILESSNKNTGATICQQGSQNSDFGVGGILSKSHYGLRTPNILSSYMLQNNHQVPMASSASGSGSGGIQKLLNFLTEKFTSGNSGLGPCANRFSINSIQQHLQPNFMEVSTLPSGNALCSDIFRNNMINVNQGQNIMEVSNGNDSANVPDMDTILADLFYDSNEEVDTMKLSSPNEELNEWNNILTGEFNELENILTGNSGSLNGEVNAMEASRNVLNPPTNQNQALPEYASLWNMLEEEEDPSVKEVSGELDPGDVDRYCQLLTNVLLGNNNGPSA